MPGPYVVPVHGDAELPKEVDVVVIGGGIIGTSTALELAEAGVRVALCEKGGIGQKQSSRNWGWVRISRRDPREVPLMAEALRKRQDGGYTIVSGHENVVDIVPKSFQFAADFLPALSKEWRSLKFRLGSRFYDEARIATRWRMDEPSPFEYCRVLDPVPAKKLSDLALANLTKAFPVFAQAEIAQAGRAILM